MSKWTPKGTSDWLAMCSPKLKPAQFQVLFHIARYADSETGECFPSLAVLAKDAGTAKSYVITIVEELVHAGCIRKVPGSQGSGHSNQYQLIDNPEALEQFTAEVKARRKARREKSEAERERYRNRPRVTKATPVQPTVSGDRYPQGQNGHADPALADLYQRGRAVLGIAKADNLITGLLKTTGDDAEEVDSILNEAGGELDPCQFIAEFIASRRP
ncbi:MarR family protein [Bradyrhizobium erythrophlei]|jgi:hypothetical protein|nr:MarR family protein [Bradyrhizobium erythrophlei]